MSGRGEGGMGRVDSYMILRGIILNDEGGGGGLTSEGRPITGIFLSLDRWPINDEIQFCRELIFFCCGLIFFCCELNFFCSVDFLFARVHVVFL